LIAISPQSAEPLETLRAERKLSFPILIDHENRVAEQFGIRHVLPEDLREVYLSFGIDLPATNGEPSWAVPMPARYVIDRQGVVRSVSADPDHTHRPDPEEIFPVLESITTS
jgi:peroxiredoxin